MKDGDEKGVQRSVKEIFSNAIKKYKERKAKRAGFVRCTRCEGFIQKQDKYCQYCGLSLRE